MRYTRTQHRPASRHVNYHGRVSGTHRGEFADLVQAVGLFEQFQHERRRAVRVSDEVGAVACPGQRHIEQAPLLREREGLAVSWWQYQFQERVVVDLGREPPSVVGEIEHDHIVRFCSFGPVDRVELHTRASSLPALVVTAQHQHRRGLAVSGPRDVSQRELHTASRVVGGDHGDAIVSGCAVGAQRALGLLGVLLYELGGRGEDAVAVSERVAQRSLLDMAEMVPAAAYEAHVASREAVDRLPVVADHEGRDAGVVEGLQQLHAARGYVLELVD